MKSTCLRFTVVVAIAAAALGCSQHEDFPTELSFIPPPAIANLSIQDNGDGTYDITWSVDDDLAVKEYRVYSFGATGLPELVGTTPSPQFGIDLFVPIGGVPIGVTAVTVENVEGAMAVAVTPDP
jgi:hypothetical protein